MPAFDWIAATAFGLESVAASELRALGIKCKVLGNGRVWFHAPAEAMVRANLWLRTADRVLLRLGTFPATDFGQLFDGTRGLPWEAWLGPDAAFPVSGRSVKSQLSSVPACQKIVKKAIVERLRQAHRCAQLSETGPTTAVEVALLDNQASLLLDTTGPGLNKRGYRTWVAEAQLKETLAAALVLLSPWQPHVPLVDPFCGTGTILLEAALIGRRLAPGRHRSFAAEAWPAIAQSVWSRARQEADELAQPEVPLDLAGSDSDPRTIGLARQHAAQVGLPDVVQWHVQPFAQLRRAEPRGILLFDPPYGQRQGQLDDVEALYRSLPEVLARHPGWWCGVLTAHPHFERLVRRTAESRRKLYNGPLECRYFQFPPLAPAGTASGQVDLPTAASSDSPPVPEPIGSDLTLPPALLALEQSSAWHTAPRDAAQQTQHQAELLSVRLAKRARHLRRWPERRRCQAFRLYDRDIPEIPLSIDRYADCLHLVEYDRPHDRTGQQQRAWLEAMAAAAAATLAVPREQLALAARPAARPQVAHHRRAGRRRAAPPDELARAAATPLTVEVTEGDLRFLVRLGGTPWTGLWLDERWLREQIRTAAQGQRCLHLGSTSGSLTTAAAVGGAAESWSIDPWPANESWCLENLRLNGCELSRHRTIVASPAEWLASLASGPAPLRYNLVTLAWPAAASGTNAADLALWMAPLQKLLAPGASLWLIARDPRCKLPAACATWGTVRQWSPRSVPEDFRQQRVHRLWQVVCP